MNRNPGRAGVHEAPFSAGGRHAARENPAAGDHESGPDDGAVDRSLLLASVARDARLDGKFVLLITLSTIIVTLGLLQNSAAVVIGAMLVSPLLGPIMGIGFGLATIESQLIRRSLVTLAAGVGVAIAVAGLLILLSPIQDVTPEIRARTQPTLLDLGVAVVGGVAGVYAILRQLSGVMVGVAIATALVPPLSTVAFGIATWRPEMAMGAALLFLTNTLAIALVATVVARINRFGPSLTPQHTAMQVVGIFATLGLLSIPLALSLNNITRELRARSTVQTQLSELLGKSGRVDTLTVTMNEGEVLVDGVVLVDSYRPDLSRQLAIDVEEQLERKVSVNMVQLRQQTTSAVQLEDRLNQRLTALERRDSEQTQLLEELTVGQLIPRSALVVDAQARRVIVRRNREIDENSELSEAIDRVIATTRSRHPGWLIETAAVEPVEETPNPDGPPQ